MYRIKLATVLVAILCSCPAFGQNEIVYVQPDYAEDADLIRMNYEENADELSRFKRGHMGLRFYRHYGDVKYIPLFMEGIKLAEEDLNRIYKRGLDEKSIREYSAKSNKSYFSTKTERKKRRSESLASFPEYRFYATKLLRHVARLDEVGLRHEHHDEFIEVLKSYDFKTVFTNKMMIKAWGAQLANQVYWLKQLGIADYSSEFIEAVDQTYPEQEDEQLSKQQFENKLYTLTHIIIAASGYYQFPVEYNDHKGIIDYFMRNAPVILGRAKEDVVIEVGISLLLTEQGSPEVDLIRQHISQQINREERMVPSVSGRTDFATGEHRNIIAVLLLDWQGVYARPNVNDLSNWTSSLPQTLSLN